MDLSVVDYDEIKLITEQKKLELSKIIISGNVQNLEMEILPSFLCISRYNGYSIYENQL